MQGRSKHTACTAAVLPYVHTRPPFTIALPAVLAAAPAASKYEVFGRARCDAYTTNSGLPVRVALPARPQLAPARTALAAPYFQTARAQAVPMRFTRFGSMFSSGHRGLFIHICCANGLSDFVRLIERYTREFHRFDELLLSR